MEKNFNICLKNHIRLIEYLASKMGQDDDDIVSDLIQEGRIGLFEAFQRYDETKGNFQGYATIWIKKHMKDFLTKNGRTIRIPSHQVFNKDFVSTTKAISLDTQIGTDNSTVADLLTSDDILPSLEDKEAVMASNELIQRLLKSIKKENQRDMVRMRFGLAPYQDEYLLKDIAVKYGITREAVRQQLKSILKQLKK